MRTIPPTVFIRDTSSLGEGPFWFEDRFWWLDIDAKTIFSANEKGEDHRSIVVGQKIGCAVPCEDRRHFIVGLEEGIASLDRETGEVVVRARPESDRPSSRFNDGKCDPAGRFLAGTLDMEGACETSALYCFENGSTRPLFGGVTCSNGLAWSADARTLYYIDSPTKKIVAFAYDLTTGTLSEPRTVVTIPELSGIPDGMTIDQDDNLWVAHWGGAIVRCYSPLTGGILAEIPTPASRPTSCCFGGPDLGTLYITSAGSYGDEADLAKYPLSGAVFSCRPGPTGFPTRLCAEKF